MRRQNPPALNDVGDDILLRLRPSQAQMLAQIQIDTKVDSTLRKVNMRTMPASAPGTNSETLVAEYASVLKLGYRTGRFQDKVALVPCQRSVVVLVG
jgi:hypothetical protein